MLHFFIFLLQMLAKKGNLWYTIVYITDFRSKERTKGHHMKTMENGKRIIGIFIIIAMMITTVPAPALPVGAAEPVAAEYKLSDLTPEMYDDVDETIVNRPIIIIPGIMGSNLYSSQNFTARNRVYAPNFSNNLLDLGLIALLGRNIRMRNTLFARPMENMNAPRARLEYGAFNWYQFLVDYLLAAFPEREIFFFSYDFRQDNRITAASLYEGVTHILSASDYDKVDIVAHSMGGLIVAGYISQFTGDTLGRVVTMGTPFEGAPQIFDAVLQGNVNGFFPGNRVIGALAGLPLLGALGTDVSSEFPAVAQVAPTQAYFSEAPFYQFSHTTGRLIRRRHYTEMSYEQYFNMLDSLFRWGERHNFQEAIEFHQSIQTNGISLLANHEDAYFAIGVNQRTISGVRFDTTAFPQNRLRITDLIYEHHGDGTVPYTSQTMMGLLNQIPRADERVRRFNTCHSGLVGRTVNQGESSDAVSWVVDVLRGNAKSTQIQDVELRSVSHTVLRIEGSVDVTIEGPEGILTSTEDELSLIAPFARIDRIGYDGEVTMVAIENWEEHQVTMYVTNDGVLNYTIRWFDDENNLVDERCFIDIPVHENQTITTNTAREESTILEVDQNGDGATDEQWEVIEDEPSTLLLRTNEPTVLSRSLAQLLARAVSK